MADTARHKVVRNYRGIDPTYDPEDVIYGKGAYTQRVVNENGGYEWVYADDRRTPWEDGEYHSRDG